MVSQTPGGTLQHLTSHGRHYNRHCNGHQHDENIALVQGRSAGSTVFAESGSDLVYMLAEAPSFFVLGAHICWVVQTPSFLYWMAFLAAASCTHSV